MIGNRELDDARHDAAREMPDAVTILRQTGSALDETTLLESAVEDAVYEDVPASVVRVSSAQSTEQGGRPLAGNNYHVRVPWWVSDVRPGDRVTAVRLSDPFQPDLYVLDVASGSSTLARLLICREYDDAGMFGG